MKLFSKHIEKEISKLLDENWIKNYKIDYRIKSIYSVYKKMQKKRPRLYKITIWYILSFDNSTRWSNLLQSTWINT